MSGSGRGGLPNKKSLLARADMDRLGINPIEYLNRVFTEAMNSYEKSYPTEKGDPRPGYLAIARSAASDLASYYYPKLSQVAVKDFTKEQDAANLMSTKDAVKVIESDPFKQIQTKDVVDQINSSIEVPNLSKGEGNS